MLTSTGSNLSYECTLRTKFSKEQKARSPREYNTPTSPQQGIIKIPRWLGDAQLTSVRGWLFSVSVRTLPRPVPQRAGLETRAQIDRGAAAAEPQSTLSGRHPAARSPRSAPASHTVLVQVSQRLRRTRYPKPGYGPAGAQEVRHSAPEMARCCPGSDLTPAKGRVYVPEEPVIRPRAASGSRLHRGRGAVWFQGKRWSGTGVLVCQRRRRRYPKKATPG